MVEISPYVQKIISRYKEQLTKQGIKAVAVFLFGSYRKGTSHEDSDIDLIIVSPHFAGMGLLDRLELLGVAAARIMEPIAAYGVTPDEIERGTVPVFWAEMLKKEALKV